MHKSRKEQMITRKIAAEKRSQALLQLKLYVQDSTKTTFMVNRTRSTSLDNEQTVNFIRIFEILQIARYKSS